MHHLFVHPLTIVRAGVKTDRYGTESPDWENPTRTDVRGWVAPLAPEDDETTSRDTQVERWQIALPVGTDVTGEDRVEIESRAFSITRAPSTFPTLRGPHHIEILIQYAD